MTLITSISTAQSNFEASSLPFEESSAFQAGKLAKVREEKQRAKKDARMAKLAATPIEESKVVEDESIAFSGNQDGSEKNADEDGGLIEIMQT